MGSGTSREAAAVSLATQSNYRLIIGPGQDICDRPKLMADTAGKNQQRRFPGIAVLINPGGLVTVAFKLYFYMPANFRSY